jgi:hypothetical protein
MRAARCAAAAVSASRRRVRRHECRSRHVQAHHFHQHLIAVGRAVERARSCGVIAAGLGFEQRISADLAFDVELPDAGFFFVGHA